MVTLLQLFIAGVWAATVIVHTRRLMRLACVTQISRWEKAKMRAGLGRIWWWLGQDRFWDGLRRDVLHSIEITLMIFLIALGQG
jgi:hypothetical protein